LGTIGNGLAVALTDSQAREPALITFLVTASGVTLFGIGSAFWGLVAGTLAIAILQGKLPQSAVRLLRDRRTAPERGKK